MAALVIVPVFGRIDLSLRCLAAIDRSTPADVELLVIDDHGPEPLPEAAVRAGVGPTRHVAHRRHDRNLGFVVSVNEAFAQAGQRDVVVVNSDVEVLPGWWQGLRAAIQTDDRVASASALSDHGGVLTVPEMQRVDLEAPVLQATAAAAPVSVPIPVAVAHCTWFTRAALAAVGGFDPAFSPGYGEEVDWSHRASRAGFRHVAASRAYVRHEGGASFAPARVPWSLPRRPEARLLVRYPREWFAVRRFARDPDTELALAKARIGMCLVDNSAP